MKALFMLLNSLPQASVAETIPPEVRFRSIGGEHRFYLEHERVYTLIKDVSFLDAPKVDAQEVIVSAGHTISWMGQRDWFNVFHVEPKDCFFVYQSEVVADLCLCDEEEDFERHCLEQEQTCLVDDDPEREDQASIDAAWDRRQKCLFVWDNRPDLSEEDALKLHAEFEVYYSAGNTFADALEWSGIAQNTHPAVRFCRKYSPYMPEQECYEAYETYRSYRDEGQSDIVSRQYAGLL